MFEGILQIVSVNRVNRVLNCESRQQKIAATSLMNSKGKMRHSCMFLIYAVVIVQLVLNVTAQQYDDDNASGKKLRLQDLENEQNQKDYEREELERLQQQQPPSNGNLQRAFAGGSTDHAQNAFRPIVQSVRPLEQKVTAARPLRPNGMEFVSSAASNFNFGISPLAHNGLDGDIREGDIDTDIVSYSHDEPPLPFNMRRPQLELLSGGGAGYALASADVLVPPFRDATDNSGHISDDRRPLSQLPPERYVRPFGISNNRPPSPYAIDEAPSSAAQNAAANYLTNSELPEAPAGTIEYASGYLPVNQLSSQRPIIQYGSPHADFRHPSMYSQSNQLAYAPIRSGSSALSSGVNVPYPPSFISITTRRPGTGFNGNGVPSAVRPLGRSLGYGKPFRPSAVDPVPDFFANRQHKSLLDSYIPSWVVARMLEQQRNIGYTEPFRNDVPYNRYLKRSDTAEARKDDLNTESKSEKAIEDRKIVKKSLDSTTEEMLMTA